MLLEHRVPDAFLAGLRLDVYVSDHLKLLSRSRLKSRLISAQVNNKTVKLSYRVAPGDYLVIEWEDERELNLEAEDIPLDIIATGSRFLVVNKVQGMVVHPGAGNPAGTLVNALLWYIGNTSHNPRLSLASGRPGIVHRLDKDTSGLIVCALDDDALALMAQEFKTRRVKKRYLAIVCGCPRSREGRIDAPLARDPRDRKRFAVVLHGGKEARSTWRVLATWGAYSLLLMELETGRTHQLRVHLRHIGCPILGDPIYGAKDRRFPNASLMLHSRRLGIRVPVSTGVDLVWKTFVAPVPSRMKVVLKDLDRYPGRQALPAEPID